MPSPLLTPETLRASLVRLIGAQACNTVRFGIAVSGGPDSMALLAVAAETFPGRVSAATVDHGLRAGSADEAAMVADACAALNVSHAILHPAVPITGSLQAAARAARYALLDEWRIASRIDWLMTAHHADDQLETLVMRLNRASGLAGLAGIRSRQGHILRPLLAVRHEALVETVLARGLTSVDDPSNRDDRFDRARVRAALLETKLLDAAAVSLSVSHLTQEEQALEWVTAQLRVARTYRSGDEVRVDMNHLPTALKRRVILAVLASINEPPPRGEALERSMAAIESGANAMLGNIILSAEGSLWTISPAPPRAVR